MPDFKRLTHELWPALRKACRGLDGQAHEWAMLPNLVLLVMIGWVWAAGVSTPIESPLLLLGFNLVFLTLVSLVILFLVSRSFLHKRSPGLLLLAGGVLLWGSAGVVSVAAGWKTGGLDTNTVLTIHNTCIWLSALCHLASVTLPFSRVSLPMPRMWLALTFTLSLAVLAGITLSTLLGVTPAFYIPGQGRTWVRVAVLSSAILMFLLTAVLLLSMYKKNASRFTFWYALSLLLFATGLFGVLITPMGSVGNWVGRLAQYLGGIYMLVAALQGNPYAGAKQHFSWEPSPQPLLAYLVTVAVVLAAATVRFAVFPENMRFAFAIFYPALVFSALYGGFGAGILATALTALLVSITRLDHGSFHIEYHADKLGIISFVLGGVLISWMAEWLRRAESHARHAEAIVTAQRDNLHLLVKERTAALELEILEHAHAERALMKSKESLHLALDGAEQGVWDWDLRTRTLSCDERCRRFLELPLQGEVRGEDGMAAMYPDDRERFREAVRAALRDNKEFQVEFRVQRKDGSLAWLHVLGRAIQDESGASVRMSGVLQEITETKMAKEALRLAAKALENASEGVIISQHGKVLSVNRGFCAITGYQAEEVVGQPVRLLYREQHERMQVWKRLVALREHGYWQGEMLGLRKNGEAFPASVSLSAVDDEIAGQFFVGVFSDISQAKETENRLQYLAHHDALTGLSNRLIGQLRLEEMVARAERQRGVIAALFIDLDHFKPINDSLGHGVGDELLRHVAERILEGVRKTDTVARLGGDEFLVLLDELKEVEEAAWIAQNLLSTLSRPFVVAEHQLSISASIGIACYPQDGKNAETILRHADVAMYRAKQDGKHTFRLFSSSMSKGARDRVFLAASLRTAVEREELILVYQPRVAVNTGEIAGVEALVRWHSPEHGLILPSRFIGLAEETGAIKPIGEWVVRTACKQMQQWIAAGNAPGFVSVNLSPSQFRQPNLVDYILGILQDMGMQPGQLELEITESVVMSNPEKTSAMLLQLAESGIRLSLDDFGTGYSSLAYLQRFPIHHLKLDRSFVRELPKNKDSANISRAIIAMARGLDMDVTAEGVETEEQLAYLKALECSYWQGFLFSAPVSPEELAQLIRRRREGADGATG